VEAVSVDRSGAPSKLSPSLKSSVFPDVSVAYINNLVGINWTGDDMASQLGRMQMPAVYVAQSNTLTVTVPHTRPDIL
jgi:phenylalanyl-tRNA synthetase beta subunit